MPAKECAVMLVPAVVAAGDIILSWDVNAYDGDGDFVTRVGHLKRSSTGATFTDVLGWGKDYEDLTEAADEIMGMTVLISANKLN